MAPIWIFNFKVKATSNLSEQFDIACICVCVCVCSRIPWIYAVASNREKNGVLILNLKRCSFVILQRTINE
jgi:benzoyl-CoA reductase/2-hydroxyglutaryl-CoA dehydratase subunit BcrC/BadD/HgdB